MYSSEDHLFWPNLAGLSLVVLSRVIHEAVSSGDLTGLMVWGGLFCHVSGGWCWLLAGSSFHGLIVSRVSWPSFIWRGQKFTSKYDFPTLWVVLSWPQAVSFYTHVMVNTRILKGDPLHFTALWTLVALIFPNTSQIWETKSLPRILLFVL